MISKDKRLRRAINRFVRNRFTVEEVYEEYNRLYSHGVTKNELVSRLKKDKDIRKAKDEGVWMIARNDYDQVNRSVRNIDEMSKAHVVFVVFEDEEDMSSISQDLEVKEMAKMLMKDAHIGMFLDEATEIAKEAYKKWLESDREEDIEDIIDDIGN